MVYLVVWWWVVMDRGMERQRMTDTAELPALVDMRESGMTDAEIALHAWVLVCDRNAAATSRYLQAAYGLEIPPNTISQWKRRHNWDVLAGELFGQAAPAKLQRLAVKILDTASAAHDYLDEVIRGTAPTNEKGEIDKGRAMVSLEYMRMVGFVAPRGSDVSLTGTSFQRSVSGMGGDTLASASMDDIEAQLKERGVW